MTPAFADPLRRPVAAVLVAFAVILGGLYSLLTLPVAELPAVDLPTIVVQAALPGASPEIMASAVAQPIEQRVGKIAGISELTSSNIEGASTITIQFVPTRDADGALNDVQSAVNAAAVDLPKDMPVAPRILRINPVLAPIVIIAARSDTMPIGELYSAIDRTIAQPLAQVEGVSRVLIQGAQPAAIRVKVDATRLAGLGLDLADVRAAVVANSGGGPLGRVETDARSFLIAADDQMLNAAAFRPLIVAHRSGAPVRLSDVAEVTDDVVDKRIDGWYNGKRALFLVVQRRAEANIVATAERVTQALPRLTRWLPRSVEVSLLSDRTSKIRETISEAWKTALVTTLGVVIVICLALRDWRASLIATITIPISLATTFLASSLCGFSIDLISLTALTVCIGFVVDDAIVVIENITRLRDGGAPVDAAVRRGIREIAFTITSITVSILAALLPLVLVPGVLGQLLREFAVTLCVAVAFSGLISLCLTPILCANLMKASSARRRRESLPSRAGAWVLAAYGRSLRRALDRPGLILAVTLGLVVLSVPLYIVVPKGFLPPQDAGVISGVTEAGQDVSFAVLSERQLAVSRVLLDDPAIETVVAYVGTSAGATAGTGRLFIGLKPRHERAAMSAVIERLRPRLKGLYGITTYLRSVDDVSVGAREGKGRYQFTLQSDDWTLLDKVFPRVVTALKQKAELQDVTSDAKNSGLQYRLRLDRDRASILNVSPLAIDDTLYDAFGQRQIATISKEFEQSQVVLESATGGRTTASVFDQTFVRSDAAVLVPLKSVAIVDEVNAALAVSHQGAFPAATISFNLAPGTTLSQASAVVRQTVDALDLPAGVRSSFEGDARAFAASSGSAPLLLAAVVLLIYVVLGILYESYVHPLTIISSLPSAGIGAVLAVVVCRTEFTMMSLIGLILLLGIVKKNAIMMIDVALVRQRAAGLDAREAIRQACMVRFRPIMMTTLTAIVGAMPLALDTGAGAELHRSFGIVVVGGLLVSQVLTLYTTPVVYIFMDRLTGLRRARAS